MMARRRLAKQIDWAALKANIERAGNEAREQMEASLRSRREKLHQAAGAAQWQGQMGSQYDRVDVFHVEYEGATVVVKLGRVAWVGEPATPWAMLCTRNLPPSGGAVPP